MWATRARRLAVAFALAGLSSCSSGEEPPTGQVLYLRHCASCHGVAADGQGPVAAALRRPPSDLRTIAKRRGGFDERYVMEVIDGRRAVAEHGLREMPVWGAVFEEELGAQRYAAYTSLLHSRSLTEYLRSLQQ
jgi:mono/diheme cytochrome c family protein